MNNTRINDNTFQSLSLKPIKGRWYRTVKDKRRSQVNSPEGSSKVDGRYHTIEEDMVLYLSDSPTLSMNESTKVFQTVPIKESAWYTATFNVELTRTMDLTDPKILHHLSITPTELVQPWPGGYRLPQAIATKARAMGFEAMLTPTARPGLSGNNLVIFLEVVANTGGIIALAM